jgi:hypothetical protein
MPGDKGATRCPHAPAVLEGERVQYTSTNNGCSPWRMGRSRYSEYSRNESAIPRVMDGLSEFYRWRVGKEKKNIASLRLTPQASDATHQNEQAMGFDYTNSTLANLSRIFGRSCLTSKIKKLLIRFNFPVGQVSGRLDEASPCRKWERSE